MSKRDVYIARMKTQLDEINAQLDKLEQMKDSGEHTWDSMVAEMDKIGDAFKHSYNYFKSQL